eukprot:UN13079
MAVWSSCKYTYKLSSNSVTIAKHCCGLICFSETTSYNTFISISSFPDFQWLVIALIIICVDVSGAGKDFRLLIIFVAICATFCFRVRIVLLFRFRFFFEYNPFANVSDVFFMLLNELFSNVSVV